MAQVHLTMFEDPMDVPDDEVEVLRMQGLLREPPQPAAESEPAAPVPAPAAAAPASAPAKAAAPKSKESA